MFLLVCMLSVDSLGARAQSLQQWTYSKAEVPNLFETRASFYGRQFFHQPGVARAGGGGDFCPQDGGHRLIHMAQMLWKCVSGHGSQSAWSPGCASHLAFHWCASLA